MAWLSVDFDSKALRMPCSLDILMPQGHGNYKTVFLLHGAGGDRTTWLLKTRISDYASQRNLAVIMPSGNNSFYVNNVNGKNYEDFISEELPALTKTWFSLSDRKEDRLIAGMSMGGYGAFVNAMHHPDVFGYAASFSGVLDIVARFDKPQGLDMCLPFGTREQLLHSRNDLFTLTEQIAKEQITKEQITKEQIAKEQIAKGHIVGDCLGKQAVDSGINCTKERAVSGSESESIDESRTRFMIMCGEQDKRIEMSERLYQHMKQLGLDVQYQSAQGKHDFTYWDSCLQPTFDWFLKGGDNNGRI